MRIHSKFTSACLHLGLIIFTSFSVNAYAGEKIESFPRETVRLFDENSMISEVLSGDDLNQLKDKSVELDKNTGMYVFMRGGTKVYVLTNEVTTNEAIRTKWDCDEVPDEKVVRASSAYGKCEQ